MKQLYRRNGKSFQVGDPIEIAAFDHSSEDFEGWKNPEELVDHALTVMQLRGWYVSEDNMTVKVAFAKCDKSFSTIFTVLKNVIARVQ